MCLYIIAFVYLQVCFFIMASHKPELRHTLRAAFVTGLHSIPPFCFSVSLYPPPFITIHVGGSGFVGQVLIGDLKKLGVKIYALARSRMYLFFLMCFNSYLSLEFLTPSHN